MRDLARSLTRLMQTAARTLDENAVPSQLVQRLVAHLRCDLQELSSVTERFAIWEHVNVQRGVDAYLGEHGSDGTWFGIAGVMRRPHDDLLSMITASGAYGRAQLGAATFGTAPVGPEENTEVVQLGMIATTAPGGAPVVIGIRPPEEFGPPNMRNCHLDVLAADQRAAIAARDEVDRLIRDRDIYRGQALTFSETEHHGNELVSFLPRPAVPAAEVILPDGVLDRIEQHIAGIGDWSAELLGSGQHLKRGLLLHGPSSHG